MPTAVRRRCGLELERRWWPGRGAASGGGGPGDLAWTWSGDGGLDVELPPTDLPSLEDTGAAALPAVVRQPKAIWSWINSRATRHYQ
ncbi:hypothetical protein E2562_039037 [Oryza meyeriana var. granulata]|uniref:Uncharacterized protein n=1 Tax=Oryza meyeriana var. granulata TaxID=110450 RepID=A0A6G1CAQ7_9ORYZ|nr:hypothetical protein E2562_039037 [Oryza meyeriana var. granulata]